MMNRNYIGLATTPHDPAIAIVNQSGEIVFAEAAERYLQNKRAWCSPPDDMIRISTLIKEYCEPECNLVIASTWSVKGVEDLQTNLVKNLFKEKSDLGFASDLEHYFYHYYKTVIAQLTTQPGINTEFRFKQHNKDLDVIFKHYNHHTTHASVACHTSPFEDAICLVIDGTGEETSITLFDYKDSKLSLIKTCEVGASFGRFYSNLCLLCGFDDLAGESWKVMGLAGYGKLDKKIYSLLKNYFLIDGTEVKLSPDAKDIIAELEPISRKGDIPPIEYADWAYTGQYVFNESLNELITNIYAEGYSDNLVLTGGCALNSSFAGQVHINTPFSNCYLFCAPADDGNAVGAALLAYYQDHPEEKPSHKLQSPYLGSRLLPEKIDFLMKFGGLKPLHFKNDQALCEYVAKQISENKIIGWAQGRAEFGPRALGNRSILANPCDPNVKERINASIKFREEFRPFAPSILAEYGDEYFEHYLDTPYMERTLPFKESMKDKVPGVVHVDGTGRLQTVHPEINEKYALLIKCFFEITGVPILLNTSFNVMGKPIVHSVEDAISVFFTSGIDFLVIENYVFDKSKICPKE